MENKTIGSDQDIIVIALMNCVIDRGSLSIDQENAGNKIPITEECDN